MDTVVVAVIAMAVGAVMGIFSFVAGFNLGRTGSVNPKCRISTDQEVESILQRERDGH